MNANGSFSTMMTKVTLSVALICHMGCTQMMYGIPEQEFVKLSEEQKIATINGYNEREKIREQTRAIAAERRAKEQAEKAEEQRRQKEIVQKRIDAIYAGEAGNLGDLVRVSIQGGDMLFGKRRRPFQPVSFKIANGETRSIETVSNDKKYNDTVELTVSYREGVLFIDEVSYRADLATRIVYDSTWKKGNSYSINTRGNRELHNVRINVEVIPPLRRN